MPSLQYELFKIANLPQSHLSKEDRKSFDFYISSAEQYAYQGYLKFALPEIPEAVISALESSENGFKISNGENQKKYLDWSSPNSKTLAQKMYNLATNPYAKLSELEKLQYETLKRDCLFAANEGKKFIEIPDNISSDVLEALGIPKKTSIFYWDAPDKK